MLSGVGTGLGLGLGLAGIVPSEVFEGERDVVGVGMGVGWGTSGGCVESSTCSVGVYSRSEIIVSLISLCSFVVARYTYLVLHPSNPSNPTPGFAQNYHPRLLLP